MFKYLLLLTTCFGGIFSADALVTSSPTTIVDKYQKTCLELINNFRKEMGVPSLKTRKSKINCTNKESKLNFESHMFHTRFGMCNENGQCECKGYQNVENCINAYIAEGPGGGHYEILRSPRFTHVTCGKYKLPYGNSYYYTHNFYIVTSYSSTKTKQPCIISTTNLSTNTKQPTKTNIPTSTKQPTSNPFVNAINSVFSLNLESHFSEDSCASRHARSEPTISLAHSVWRTGDRCNGGRGAVWSGSPDPITAARMWLNSPPHASIIRSASKLACGAGPSSAVCIAY
jgi:hypothetical protein